MAVPTGSHRVVTFIASLLALVVGISSGNSDEKPDLSFPGLWNTSYGKLRLVETGDGLKGCYKGGGGEGLLSGKMAEGKFVFEYTDIAEGEGEFELSEDGMSFSGKWREKGTEDWTKWNGRRILPDPGVKMLVVIEARWEAGLTSDEFSFGEMLDSYFERVPHVVVRERFFNNYEGFTRWCREIAYVAEPVVVSLASHGNEKALTVDGKEIPADKIADALQYSSNIELLQFSACSIMAGDAPKVIQDSLAKHGVRFPVSGYAKTVPWGLSATLEFAYFGMILEKGMKPSEAAEELLRMMPHAGDKPIKGSVHPPMHFRFRPAAE